MVAQSDGKARTQGARTTRQLLARPVWRIEQPLAVLLAHLSTLSNTLFSQDCLKTHQRDDEAKLTASSTVCQWRHPWIQAWSAQSIQPHITDQNQGRRLKGRDTILPWKANCLHYQGQECQERVEVPRQLGKGLQGAR